MLKKGHCCLHKALKRKKEESERLRGEGDWIKFLHLRFERRQVVRFRQPRRRQEWHLFASFHNDGCFNAITLTGERKSETTFRVKQSVKKGASLKHFSL